MKAVSDSHCVVERSFLDAALADFASLSLVRVVPSFKNGVTSGFKLLAIVPDSLYAKIGLQNGDIVHRIGGYELNSAEKRLEIYQKLREANRLELEFERRGETVRRTYSIE